MSQRILMVDDDELIRTMVAHLLKKAGYTVLLAADGPTALTLYEQEQPDLIILDISMPQMSGIEVAQRIRALQQTGQRPHTPILLLTAYARSFFRTTGNDALIDSYLTKPITPDKLLAHVQQFLTTRPDADSSV